MRRGDLGHFSDLPFDGLAGSALAFSLQTPISLSLGRDDLPSADAHGPRGLLGVLQLVKEAPGNVIADAKLRNRQCLAASIDLAK